MTGEATGPPHKQLLDRETSKAQAEEHFQDALELLDDLAEYGLDLQMRCYNGSAKNIEDVVVLGVMLKQAVAMLDAMRILIGGGSVFPSNLELRAMLEASLYAEWILKADSHARANAYYVANARAERELSQSYVAGKFDPILKARLSKEEEAALLQETNATKKEADRVLAQPELAAVDANFDQVRGKRKYDPNWHEVVGAKSVRSIADDLGRLTEYDWLYSSTSTLAHCSSYKAHVNFSGGQQISFKAVRSLEGITQVLNMAVSTAIKTFEVILEHYRPGELDNFARKYRDEWRGRFLAIKSVRMRAVP